jgi:sortase A
VLSGHRTTYGAPFRELDRLRTGDRITIEVPSWGTTVFEVRSTLIVAPSDVWVASGTGGVRLTLTTCHPAGSDQERLVVQAEAVDGPAARFATPAMDWSPSTPPA